MRKILIAIAAVCFTLAAGLSFADTKPKDLNDFTPMDDTYPVAPDEHAIPLAERYDFIAYRLENDKGQCTGVALANSNTRFYQRMEDIGCDPIIDHVSMSPSEVADYITVNFYHKTVNVGRITIHQ
ncbi:hypothetical protein BIZ83_gp088 [Erwinia phage vB_EamM_ChrisDB]|uniref:hypothetical protein n=1 Tax=Erwinia phage vB_EamM_ChrisDB TaxID=1883371 RepID=UPI00081D14C2|nr:hypothetical protein BIZ83_gp088 [Erwinia phage vB_EamM_ChrisDB]ANZ48765.1 hypothetical protein CHRISDB_203 [Erwinia phage vB_EamM_ChrisDB]